MSVKAIGLVAVLLIGIPPMVNVLFNVQPEEHNIVRIEIEKEYNCNGEACLSKLEFKQGGFMSSPNYKGSTKTELLNVLRKPRVQENTSFIQNNENTQNAQTLGIVLLMFGVGLPMLFGFGRKK